MKEKCETFKIPTKKVKRWCPIFLLEFTLKHKKGSR